MGSSASCSSSPSSWRPGSRSWEETLQVAPTSPAGGHVVPLSPARGHVAPLPHAGGGHVAAPSPGGGQRSLEESPHLHLHSSTCAFTPPPTPSPTLSAGSVQLDVSFSHSKRKPRKGIAITGAFEGSARRRVQRGACEEATWLERRGVGAEKFRSRQGPLRPHICSWGPHPSYTG